MYIHFVYKPGLMNPTNKFLTKLLRKIQTIQEGLKGKGWNQQLLEWVL